MSATPQGQVNNLASFVSTVFIGKMICQRCSLPFSNLTPIGLCMKCDEDSKTALAVAALTQDLSPKVGTARGFQEALEEVRRNGRPFVVDMAQAAMDALGGPKGLVDRIATDLKAMRGEHLDFETRQFHVPDWKVIKGLYEALIKLASEHDKVVGGGGDPLEGLSEQDLMAVAAQAAFGAVESDPVFRKEILSRIVQSDPQAVIDAAAEAIDVLVSGPRVEVR